MRMEYGNIYINIFGCDKFQTISKRFEQRRKIEGTIITIITIIISPNFQAIIYSISLFHFDISEDWYMPSVLKCNHYLE